MWTPYGSLDAGQEECGWRPVWGTELTQRAVSQPSGPLAEFKSTENKLRSKKKKKPRLPHDQVRLCVWGGRYIGRKRVTKKRRLGYRVDGHLSSTHRALGLVPSTA